MKYRLKASEEYFAITFDGLVECGKAQDAVLHNGIRNGMPWSFQYLSHPVTHENDDCYLVGSTVFRRGMILVTDSIGGCEVVSPEHFNHLYEAIV